MNNSEIRNVTKEVLKGKYKNVMLPFLLATLLLSLTQQQELYSSAYEAYGLSYVFTIGSLALFIQGPISIGLATYSLSIANEKEYSYTQIISAFKYSLLCFHKTCCKKLSYMTNLDGFAYKFVVKAHVLEHILYLIAYI